MKNYIPIFLLLIVFIVQGCATPARVDKMIISSQDIVQHDKNTPLKENTMVGSIIAVERLKLATEGAARVNITKLIEKLYELKINPSDVSVSG